MGFGKGFFKGKSRIDELTGRDDNEYFIRKRSQQKAFWKWIVPGVDDCSLCNILRTVLDQDSDRGRNIVEDLPLLRGFHYEPVSEIRVQASTRAPGRLIPYPLRGNLLFNGFMGAIMSPHFESNKVLPYPNHTSSDLTRQS